MVRTDLRRHSVRALDPALARQLTYRPSGGGREDCLTGWRCYLLSVTFARFANSAGRQGGGDRPRTLLATTIENLMALRVPVGGRTKHFLMMGDCSRDFGLSYDAADFEA